MHAASMWQGRQENGSRTIRLCLILQVMTTHSFDQQIDAWDLYDLKPQGYGATSHPSFWKRLFHAKWISSQGGGSLDECIARAHLILLSLFHPFLFAFGLVTWGPSWCLASS